MTWLLHDGHASGWQYPHRAHVRQDTGDVKTHAEPRALVVRLFPDRDYGFLATPDGREIYFHRNAVLHDDYERLEVGTEVRYEVEMGHDGPQASTVQLVSKPGVRSVGGRPDDTPAAR